MRYVHILLLGLAMGLGLNAAAPDIKTVCASGCDFTNAQTAINAVISGMNSTCDHVGIVLLRAGESFSGMLHLGAKVCPRQFILRTDAYRSLPNRRITPADIALLARITIDINGYGISLDCFLPGARSPDGTPCYTNGGVTNILIQGLVISPDTNSHPNYAGILAGEAASIGIGGFVQAQRWEWLPTNIDIDQVYVYDENGIRMSSGVKASGTGIRVMRSHFRDIVDFNDSQAVATAAARDLRIENNYMSVSGESVIVGGSGPGGTSLPSVYGERNSIIARGNYSYKNPLWYLRSDASVPTSNPCYTGSYWFRTTTSQWYTCVGGTTWTTTTAPPWGLGDALVKNHFESKDGNSEFIGNMAVGGWTQAQSGQCVHVPTFGQQANVTPRTLVIGNYCDGTGGMFTGFDVGIGSGWVNAAVYNNLAIRMWHPDQSQGVPGRVGIVFHSQRDLRVHNNTIHSQNLDWSPFVVADNRPPAGLGFTGFTYINDNAVGSFGAGYPVFASSGFGTKCNINGNIGTGAALDTSHFAAVVGSGDGVNCLTPYPIPSHPHPFWEACCTVFAASNAALWTNPTGGDFTIKSTLTGAINSARNGKNMGADIPMVLAYKATAESGTAPPAFVVKNGFAVKSGSNLVVYYTAPSTGSCNVTASAAESFSSTAGTVSQTRVGLAGVATISGLSNGRWFVRVACGAFFEDVKGIL